MASTTLQAQVESLVSRRVAEAKVQGSPTPDIEASAVFESIGLNLLMMPRTVLYAAHLARNGALATAQNELNQITTLLTSVQDSTNQTFEITSTSSLEVAKNSLLQLEDLAKVDPDSSTFKAYSSSVDDFLVKQLSKNVRRKGATELLRTGGEATSDLPPEFATLKSLHTSLINKLYALAVGVDNFTTSPMATILGVTTAYRARKDLQDIIDSVASDVSGAQSRDYATRLIASRAALKVLGAPPDILGPVLDSATQKPDGYALLATTGSSPAAATSAVGPFTLTGGATLTATTGGTVNSVGMNAVIPSENSPALFSTPLTFPIVIPANYHLYLKVETTSAVTLGGGWSVSPDGTYTHATYGGDWGLETNYVRVFRLPLSAGSVASMAALTAMLTTAMTFAFADAGITINLGTTTSFLTNRFVLYLGSAFQSVSVASHYVYPSTPPTFFTSSANTLLGLQIGQTGTRNAITAQTMTDGLNGWFPGVTASRNADETVTLTTDSSVPGTTLQLTGVGSVDLGFPTFSVAVSPTVTLVGTVYGVSYPLFDPSQLVEVGDTVVLPTGTSTVTSVSTGDLTLAASVQTFANGNINVTSALVSMWGVLSSKVSEAVTLILNSKYAEDLSSIDLAIAALSGAPTAGKRNYVTTLLNDLQGVIQSVVTLLSDPTAVLAQGSSKVERENANSVITALEERKFDKAADYFIQCKLHEMFEMDFMTASYAGAMMKSSSDLVRTDVRFPDRAKDEDTKATVQKNRSINL